MAVADEQVGRLDVAVGQAGVPQLADEQQAVVDDAVVDLGLAELGGVGDELGDEQVLPLGAELDEPVRAGRGQPGEMQLVQRVVLLLHEPPDGVERLLVLQPAIQQFPSELVPAVGAQMAAGVELGEQPAVRARLATLMRSGVDPAEPARPNGSIVSTINPSWSSSARRIAWPRAPPTSRCAARRRR